MSLILAGTSGFWRYELNPDYTADKTREIRFDCFLVAQGR